MFIEYLYLCCVLLAESKSEFLPTFKGMVPKDGNHGMKVLGDSRTWPPAKILVTGYL